ncbi:MAG: phage virion morphogenesis protein [Peptococcaceae bacterium]|nr:phage virion morphogenesis protein [Peptococcaceae bacterium]
MSGIKATGDWSRLKDSLHRLAGMSFRAIHKDIGEHLVTSTKDRFKTETAPDGTRWTQSIRARNEGGQTLTDSAILKNSVAYTARPDRVEVGTNDKRAGTHQFGCTIRPKRAKHLQFRVGKRWVRKKEVQIPKREFMGINEDDQAAINDILRSHIEERLK